MLFYFSGTGNSSYAANCLASAQKDKLISIAAVMADKQQSLEYSIEGDEVFGIVYPIHAWAPPQIVLDFIRKININGNRPYVFSVATCGSEEGLSTRILRKVLKERNINLDSSFTLVMPNNYLFGIDVDSQDVAAHKLRMADEKLITINKVIADKQKDVFLLDKGRMSAMKSYIINPLFNKFAMNTKHFYATDKCNSCKTCEAVCPVNSIKVDIKPAWKRECTHCLACINSCPQQAIEYGRKTIGRDRYLHLQMRELIGSAQDADAKE